jgi:hypothetical protein
MLRPIRPPAVIAMALALSGTSSAAFVEYLNDWPFVPPPEQWFIDAGPVTTLDFVGLAPQQMTNQYADLGVIFPGNDFAYTSFICSDGFGLKGGLPWGGSIELKFDQPRTAFAVLFPGDAFLKLFWQGQLIFTNGGWGSSPWAPLAFIGLIGDQPFDEVHIIDPLGSVHIDNIYFGASVPGPGVLSVLLPALCWSGRGRRRT